MAEENVELPPVNEEVKNLADGMYMKLDPEYSVAEWSPERDGVGPPTEVHLTLKCSPLGVHFVLGIKSREAADRLVAAIRRHRDSVWKRD